MKVYSYLKGILAVVALVVFASCDDDYNSIGSNIVGNDNMDLQSYTSENVIAYNRATGPVQADSYPLNSLGVIDNPVFGKTIVSYVTQLRIVSGTGAPSVLNPEITKVELTVPYFSTLVSTDENGNQTYKLDSLYTSENAKFRLNVYESGYYLRDFDPDTNFEEYQKYYSNMYDQINSAKIGQRLNNSEEATQNDEFFFDPAEYVIYEDDGVTVSERLKPQMKIELDKDFFMAKIFNAPVTVLESDNAFKNYFKGLFFQVEDTGNGTHLSQLNFAQGKITIYYTYDLSGEVDARGSGSAVINLDGNSISLHQNQYSNNYMSALSSANETTGDEKLYVKGGEGSVAYLDLFAGIDADGNGVSDELEELRQKVEDEKWLINEANLVFFIDQSQMNSNSYVPNRLFIFDANNAVPLVDYSNDATTYPILPKYNKYIHGGILDKDENGKGYRYKFRITKHIQNLLKNSDAKNVKLGVCVTESISQIAMISLLNSASLPSDSPYKYIPAASVMHPTGTVIYGNNTAEAAKKLKLEIRYTKP